jgi:hypothetical protein
MSKPYLVRQIVTIEYEQMIEANSEAEIMGFKDANSNLSEGMIERLLFPKYFAVVIESSNEIEEIIAEANEQKKEALSNCGKGAINKSSCCTDILENTLLNKEDEIDV